jgi:ATP-binding cassette subfamily G (WHITE) protein 2 (SNQ2)
VLLLFAGFLIPPNDMSPAFGWLHYINPMFYGFENVSSPRSAVASAY